jgi:peptidoglycan/LPS O-acetylase OafA/YrhL
MLLIVTKVINLNQIASVGFIGWFLSTICLIPVYHAQMFSQFGVGVINGSLWTIPVEMSFYVILPFLAIFKKKKGIHNFLLLILILSIIGFIGKLILSGETIIEKLYGVSFLPYFYVFASGMLLGEFWHKVYKSKWLFLLSIILYYAIFLLNNNILDKFGFIPLSYAVMWFAFEVKHKKILNKVTKFGDASFGLYIWHMVVVNFFIYFGVDKKITGTLLVLVVIILSYVMSIISWTLIEKPALKLKKYSSVTN